MMKKKLLIVAGGTGGHIMPALALAESLKKQAPLLPIEFVHGPSALEQKIYAPYAFPTYIFSQGRLRKNVSKKERIKTFITLPFFLLKALKLIIKIKPTLILGTGGAISGPLLLAGFLLKKKIILFEPNALPGLSHRWLAPFAYEIWVVFEEAKAHFKLKNSKKFKKVAFPLRPALARVPVKETLTPPLKVLILGGSQGSSVLNKVVFEFVNSLESHSNDQELLFSFVHQTGQKEFEIYKKLYTPLIQRLESHLQKENHLQKDHFITDSFRYIQVFPFLQEIHKFYAWSDVVVGRSGAGFLAELSLVQRAGILVPLLSSADQHQFKNAKFLEKSKSALVIEEKHFNKESLKKVLTALRQKPQDIATLSSRLHRLKLGAEARDLASYLLKRHF